MAYALDFVPMAGHNVCHVHHAWYAGGGSLICSVAMWCSILGVLHPECSVVCLFHDIPLLGCIVCSMCRVSCVSHVQLMCGVALMCFVALCGSVMCHVRYVMPRVFCGMYAACCSCGGEHNVLYVWSIICVSCVVCV